MLAWIGQIMLIVSRRATVGMLLHRGIEPRTFRVVGYGKSEL